MIPIDPLLLTTVRIVTFAGLEGLTNASGFFFRRAGRLYLVSSRHVFIDEAANHHPDRIEIELHADADNLADAFSLSVLLYRDGLANWRQGRDDGGGIDVAVLEIEPGALPATVALEAFTPEHLPGPGDDVPIGEPVLIPGFPLGFHDGLHHFPVVRQGAIASPYGWRFQGRGWFLTDARTHRGISGAPLVVRAPALAPLPWRLVGIHSSRFDMGNRDRVVDESLGLNASWYPDILMTLTEPDENDAIAVAVVAAPAEVGRLAALQRDIADAEQTLQSLRLAIQSARSEEGLVAANDARVENERLQVQNRLITQEADSANAALEVAIRAAQTDPLTGLCNREVLQDRLGHDLALARRHGHRLALYFLDVNDFKKVNDEFGHAVGDLLLQHVAQVLISTVRASDTVCRIGGDEFVVLAAAARREDAQQVAAKIEQALGAPCTLGGHAMSVSASIGISLFPDDGESPGVLMHKADEAMYRLKRAAARRR